MFSLGDCRFKVSESKLSTARVAAWNEFKIINSFTLENSFYGFRDGYDENRVFNKGIFFISIF